MILITLRARRIKRPYQVMRLSIDKAFSFLLDQIEFNPIMKFNNMFSNEI